MRCDFCAYEFKMKEIQEGVECPRCAASKREAKPARAQPGAFDVGSALKRYPGAQPVVILDVNMSFNSMVWFMIKWALAAIPALIILSLMGLALAAVFGVAGRLT